MLLRALVTAAETVTRFLHRLGEDPDSPPIAPARKPPFFTSQALRRKLGELHGDSRLQMGAAHGPVSENGVPDGRSRPDPSARF